MGWRKLPQPKGLSTTPLATITVTAVSQLQGHPRVGSFSAILPPFRRARGVHREAGRASRSAGRSPRGEKCYGG